MEVPEGFLQCVGKLGLLLKVDCRAAHGADGDGRGGGAIIDTHGVASKTLRRILRAVDKLRTGEEINWSKFPTKHNSKDWQADAARRTIIVQSFDINNGSFPMSSSSS